MTKAWYWIPSLYFAEGLPYFIVNSISIVMFTDLGVSKGQMAFFTSLLYLPWVIKPFWSPFVDIFKTKRWWIICMQLIMSLCFIALAFSFPSPSKEMIASSSTPISLFTLSMVIFFITAFASATHDVAADGYYMLALEEDEQAYFVGIRSTFYRLASWFTQGVLVLVAGWLELSTKNIPLSIRILFISVAILFALITLYHSFQLRKPRTDMAKLKEGTAISVGSIFREFSNAFITFFKKKYVIYAILFMLLFRLPEALMLKLVYPFFTDSLAKGGLGVSHQVYGIAYGTVGIIALTLGGIAGGIFASRVGLKRALWPMVAAITLPSIVFLYLSVFPSSNIYLLSTCIGLEQFGYGFGFQAYMLYTIYFSIGEFKTSHYAICTGFMAAGMMIPGMFAGWLCDVLGYEKFFALGMLTCLATLVVALLIKIDANYAKMSKTNE